MKVYVDIDDVLCETAATLCGVAADVFGRHVNYGDVREFDLQRVFSLTDEEMVRFRALSHEPSLLAAYPVTPGAVEGVLALRDAGHEVDIVTGRPAAAHIGTEAWLSSAGLGGFAVTYVDKYNRAGCYPQSHGDPPTVSLKELRGRRYDVAIDDSPVVLDRLAEWSESRVLVFSRPWNEDYRLSRNMRRVGGWREISQMAWALQRVTAAPGAAS